METNIFDAARAGNLPAVIAGLAHHPDLTSQNPYGFTVLHCAASGCCKMDESTAVAMIEALLKAGCPIETPSRDGRTPLFMAAEFSRSLGPLKLLVHAGANPDVRNAHGVHIVTNAMLDEAQKYLSTLTGHPLPLPRLRLKSVKLDATGWREAKSRLDTVFAELSQSGFIALQNAGTTQEDGFSDCSEEFHARNGSAAGLHGFCFYTRQDRDRAKRTSQLSLAFWAAPDGTPDLMTKAGQAIVTTFQKHGFQVDWNGSPFDRPTIYLQSIGQTDPNNAASAA